MAIGANSNWYQHYSPVFTSASETQIGCGLVQDATESLLVTPVDTVSISTRRDHTNALCMVSTPHSGPNEARLVFVDLVVYDCDGFITDHWAMTTLDANIPG